MIAASSPGTPVRSSTGFTAVSHIFVMEWAAVLLDIVIGLLIAGAIGAWVARSSRWAASLSDVSGVLVVQVDDNGVPQLGQHGAPSGTCRWRRCCSTR